MTGSLFYLTSTERQLGTVKRPTWGLRVLEAGVAHPFYRREVAFERRRLEDAPGAPSRLTAAFAFQDLAALEQEDDSWRAGERRLFVYEVVPSPGARLFRCDMAWITTYRVRSDDPEGQIEAARAYWQGVSTGARPIVEVITDLPLQIVGLTKVIDPA